MTTLVAINVLVTRPHPSGAALCEQLVSNGAGALHLPTLVFAPPPDVALFHSQIAGIADYHWLIFISPQAALIGLKAMKSQGITIPSELNIAAVGAGTAQFLQREGFADVIYPKTAWGSEALLRLSALQAIRGQKFMIIRGRSGRDVLEIHLQARGALVQSVIAYQKSMPKIEIKPYVERMQNKQIDAIVCGSFESVANLKALLGEVNWPLVKCIPLIVVSERIKELAQNLNFQTIWVAANASHEAILALLAKKKEELWQMKS